MSRYIDADALKANYVVTSTTTNSLCHLYVSIEDINSAPSIDIVRCAECKHNYNTAINHGKMQPRCDFADWKLTENDYCSRGEREGE